MGPPVSIGNNIPPGPSIIIEDIHNMGPWSAGPSSCIKIRSLLRISISEEQGVEKRLELVETLRSVTEGPGKVPNALAATIKEALQTASDLLSDLQVETYSSMERREKTELILEQMRLLIAVARLKDAEVPAKQGKIALGSGEPEWVKAKVGGRKVNKSFLKEKANEVCSIMDLMGEAFND
ncbi:hypothetical protein EV702DRAFT_1246542 [Suillus placidus]|uniref:PSMD12/CSN4-like N-terminal domain-containing protein n=1 Tax=Suillus placidus TaxID=48579 RepID=A0A9P6ZM77_9AGAM|nr:hypothetical protein EV702DRAFT_1246542 [Suillus placidus]